MMTFAEGKYQQMGEIGGRTRALNQDEVERKWVALTGAQVRSRNRNTSVNWTPAKFLRIFRRNATNLPWAIYATVGRDGRCVTTDLADDEILRRVRMTGGPIGFVGVLLLRGEVRFYTQTLAVEPEARETLDRVANDVANDFQLQLDQAAKLKRQQIGDQFKP
jgi:hypothetical protein